MTKLFLQLLAPRDRELHKHALNLNRRTNSLQIVFMSADGYTVFTISQLHIILIWYWIRVYVYQSDILTLQIATEGLSSDEADFEDLDRNADLYIFNQGDRQD